MRAFYPRDAKPKAQDKTDEALAAMGLKLERQEEKQREEEPRDECWTDNWLSFLVFAGLDTQWDRVEWRSRDCSEWRKVGLKYESIPVLLQTGGIDKKEHARILQDLCVMEREALTVFNES